MESGFSSFSIKGNASKTSSSSTSKRKQDEEIAKEFVISVGDGQIESLEPKQKKGPAVIPLQKSVHSEAEMPLLMKFRNPDLDHIKDEQERFKADVGGRPDQGNVDDYERVPIEDFGTALLRGMGWDVGKPVGLTNARVVEPFEIMQKPGARNAGIGAEALMPMPTKKKIIKPGESRDPKDPQVVQNGVGGFKSIRKLDEKTVALSKTGVHEGGLVSVINGPHEGLLGRVMKINTHTNQVDLRLYPSEEDVVVAKSDLTVVNQEVLSDEHKGNISQKSQESKPKSKTPSKSDPPKQSESSSSSKSPSWLRPHLVVRIVNKEFQSGKYYLKKGTIVDVFSPTECSVQILDSDRVLEVKQSMLETVIPAAGGKIIAVIGKHQGNTGVILDKTKSGATVQLTSNLQVVKFDLDSICQYTGANID